MNVKIFNGTPEQVEKDIATFMAGKIKFRNAMLQRNVTPDFKFLQSQSTSEKTVQKNAEGDNVTETSINLTVTIFWE